MEFKIGRRFLAMSILLLAAATTSAEAVEPGTLEWLATSKLFKNVFHFASKNNLSIHRLRGHVEVLLLLPLLLLLALRQEQASAKVPRHDMLLLLLLMEI